jgi:ribosomal protein S18 acetylase RimI-like enzyme
VTTTTIELLAEPTDREVDDLAALLVDTVEGGASVGFLLPLALDAAATWWREVLADDLTDTWVARAADGAVVGCVRLTLAWKPNSRHRGEISKLMVARSVRRQGLATSLMDVAESAAWARGLRLLLLDTETDSPAQPFYVARGWRVVGVIEDYAATPYGDPAATTILELRQPLGQPLG